ncbi:MAG: putative ATPase [Flavipsychrobacter sp.]|jgi:predicted ATPase/class 3 adenylate cyclase|nr:putative ATPase [Flavipsychrobacter sp.]
MIKNFTQDDLIYISDSSTIIHGKGEHADNPPACMKVLNDEFPTSDQSWYFENEYEFSYNVNCNSIRKAIGQTTIENHRAIILEYIAGADLKQYTQAGKVSHHELLSLATDIAFALAELHKEDVIHNNISPGNILIQQGTSRVLLIDLQIASRNSLKLEDTNNHILRKAVLSYVAPEQTGRINRLIDYRTDLYSLGIVLYEMFTGQLPFVYTDPAELIYAHLAKIPAPPDALNQDISPMLSAVIMKLLAKNAEDRYQSAIGVYHDLKYCLLHYADKAFSFAIAQNDFSGKLFIHPTLYGKEENRRKLFRLFENCAAGSRELLFVYGYSGCGKTSLINELQKPVNDWKGFFVGGKFEPFQQDTPYSAFILAFNELINYFLKQDAHLLAKWKEAILEKVGALGQVLIDLLPDIETLIGKQPELPHLKGAELQSRFNYVLGNFIKAIACEEHPLVIFIDDLQWADASSLNLFDLIMSDKEAKYIMLIGAYRDGEITEEHALSHLLNKFKTDEIPFHKIEVVNLVDADVKRMVDELLRTNQDNSTELAQLIYTKTKGNPFHIHRFLQSIYDEGNLFFDFDKKEWCWKKDDIAQMNVSGNVAELMESTIRKLPARTIDVLKVAACIGNRFDLDRLSISMKMAEGLLQNVLQPALAEGLIISAASHYKFAHDRIQQTIYSLIPDGTRQEVHLNIGKALSASIPPEEVNEHIFDLVNHWNIGVDILDVQDSKDFVADLNLRAGRKARTSAAYEQALLYFEKGLLLLSGDCWARNYNFTLQLFDEAAEIAFLCGEMDRVEELVNIILANAKNLNDSIKAYEVKIQKLIAGNQQNQAISLGLSILQKFGIKFPAKPGKLDIVIGLIKTNMMLGKKPSSFFENLPLMTDPGKLAVYRILSELLSAGYFAAPSLVPLLIFRMVQLSVKEGLSPKSPFAFGALGYIQSAYIGKVDEGINYGNISLNVSAKLKTDELDARLLMTYYVFLVHWKMRLYDINEELEKAFKKGLETGDNEYTTYLAQNIVYNSFYSGVHLQKLADKAELLDRQVVKFRQDLTLIRLRIFSQCIDNLINKTSDWDILSGPMLDEKEVQLDETAQNYSYFQNLNLQRLVLALIFNKDDEAYNYACACEKYQEATKGSVLEPVFYFYQALAITGIYKNSEAKKKPELLKKLKNSVKKLKKYESLCKENYGHKRMLVEAELYAVLGDEIKARNLYDFTIKIAVENHMIQDEAISWERTGKFYHDKKHEKVALFYLQNALNAYQRWGAYAKVKHMSTFYDELKKPAGGTNASSLDSNDIHNVDIDMSTIVKAYTALSGEIILSKLLEKLMQILIENAGAQQGCLILEKSGERVIEAEIIAGSGEIRTLQSMPLNSCNTIARSVVNYVALKREPVLLDRAVESTLFGDDEYIKRQQPKSILCAPLINQGKLQGVIYLSNDITAGAFTKKRLEFVRLLSGQIAISIENALFYDKLEQRVEERTRELQLEKKKTDDLLLNILPKEVADELKNTGRSKARRYDQVTVMFTDFRNFTQHSMLLAPEELVGEVDLCFREFDRIITKHGLEKIKTIGDAYLCVGGIPDDRDGALRVVRAAIEMRDFMNDMQDERAKKGQVFFEMRIGITTGPVVAGIVGEKKFAYDIWGDTVNTAARMEQSGEVGKINISGVTYELIRDKFGCQYRGKVSAKNKGEIDMYFVEKEKVAVELAD